MQFLSSPCVLRALTRNRGGVTSRRRKHGDSTCSRPASVVAPGANTPRRAPLTGFYSRPLASAARVSKLISLPRPRERRLMPYQSPILITELIAKFDWNGSTPPC